MSGDRAKRGHLGSEDLSSFKTVAASLGHEFVLQ